MNTQRTRMKLAERPRRLHDSHQRTVSPRPDTYLSRRFVSKSVLRERGPVWRKKGFTLIEVLVVIGIIAVLAAMVLVAVNPARQFKLARDTQRTSNVESILNAVQQNMSEHRGTFTCDGVVRDIPPQPTFMTSTSTSGGDIASCVVPDYIASLPFDPSMFGSYFTSTTSYSTGYQISRDAQGRITTAAIGELTPVISTTR